MLSGLNMTDVHTIESMDSQELDAVQQTKVTSNSGWEHSQH